MFSASRICRSLLLISLCLWETAGVRAWRWNRSPTAFPFLFERMGEAKERALHKSSSVVRAADE